MDNLLSHSQLASLMYNPFVLDVCIWGYKYTFYVIRFDLIMQHLWFGNILIAPGKHWNVQRVYIPHTPWIETEKA